MSKLHDVPVDLETRFNLLAARWKEETGLLSDSTKIAAHPAYQEVIRMGPPVAPLLLRDMEKDHSHWFEALSAITGARPVPPEHAGQIPAMVQDWLVWGRERGLI